MSKYEKYSWFATAEEQQKEEKQKISKRNRKFILIYARKSK